MNSTAPIIVVVEAQIVTYSYEPESFTLSFIYSFLFYWVCFYITELLFVKYNEKVKEMSRLQQRNFVVYVMELIITTLLVIPFIVFGIQVFVDDPELNQDAIRGIVLVAVFLLNLYLYEMAYKIQMPKSLVLHHIATLVLIALAVYRFQATLELVSLKGTFSLGTHACFHNSVSSIPPRKQ